MTQKLEVATVVRALPAAARTRALAVPPRLRDRMARYVRREVDDGPIDQLRVEHLQAVLDALRGHGEPT